MANPASDYPTAVHTPVDVSAFAAEKLGSSATTHTDLEGQQEAELVAIQTKVGIGASTPSTDGHVLTVQADGSTAWEALPAGGTGDMKADGTVAFTAKVSYNAAKTFTGDLELVSKDYVDGAITAAGGYTDEAAQDAVGAMIADTATIDLTYVDATPALTADVKDGSITLAKQANLAANTIIGRVTASTGVPEALTAANVRTIINVADGATANAKISGATLDSLSDDTGFVTAKAIQDGKNVPHAAPGTSGNLLVSNGTDWTSAANTSLPLAGGTMSGNILQGEDTALQLDTVLSGDEKHCGITEIGTMGYAATAGDLVYLQTADTKWEKAKADAAATSSNKLGLVTVSTSENATCEVLLYGKMRSAAFPTLTVGAPVYISAATAGAITSTAPTGTTNFVIRKIGFGNTAEDLFFCPDNTFLELA